MSRTCTFVGPLAGLGQLALGEEGGEGDAAGEGLGVVQRAVQGQRRAWRQIVGIVDLVFSLF